MVEATSTGSKAPRWYLIAALVLLFVASVGALWILSMHDPQPGTLKMELFKAVLQLGVIAVAAAALAILSFDYQFHQQQEATTRERNKQAEEKRHERDRQEALREGELVRRRLEYREELLRTILGRATSSYSTLKKARRFLRARAIREVHTGKIILTTPLRRQMDVVNDVQLDFENLQRDVDNSHPAFSRPKALVEKLRTVDAYLKDLIEEYEDERPGFSEEGSLKPFAHFSRLQDFLGRSKGSSFMRDVIHPFHSVQHLLRADLLNPQLVDLTPVVARGETVDTKKLPNQGMDPSAVKGVGPGDS